MQRYYFDFQEGDHLDSDDEGLEFASLAEAHSEAMEALGGALKDLILQGKPRSLSIHVRDSSGAILAVHARLESEVLKR